jgi:hypothetical protein
MCHKSYSPHCRNGQLNAQPIGRTGKSQERWGKPPISIDFIEHRVKERSACSCVYLRIRTVDSDPLVKVLLFGQFDRLPEVASAERRLHRRFDGVMQFLLLIALYWCRRILCCFIALPATQQTQQIQQQRARQYTHAINNSHISWPISKSDRSCACMHSACKLTADRQSSGNHRERAAIDQSGRSSQTPWTVHRAEQRSTQRKGQARDMTEHEGRAQGVLAHTHRRAAIDRSATNRDESKAKTTHAASEWIKPR